MAVWQVDIEKQWIPSGVPGDYMTNVYHVNAADAAAAVAAGNAIVLLEKTLMSTAHFYQKMRVQQTVPAAPSGILVPLTGTGSRGLTGDQLPLFCVVRVDFFPDTGRPSRKYLRTSIQESEQANGSLTSAYITSITTSYLTPLLATAQFCDPQGQSFTRGVVNTLVAMRQLRRGSRRRTTPVL